MGSYRKFALFIKGLLYDSKGGYDKASEHFNQEDLNVDVTGMVYLITGANSGIGFSTAKAIALRGGEVHLVCRNEEKAEFARESIAKESGNENIHVHILNLARLSDVRTFVKKFASEHEKLDVLVNNAGEMIPDFVRTEPEGLETNFATNVAGPYVLTTGLLPLLKKSKRPRVINVGSAGMQLQRLNVKYFDKEERTFEGIMAYAQCKRQLAVLTRSWAEENESICFFCMHPGWVDTPAARRGLGEFYEKMKEKFRNSDEGADTVIWLSISEAALAHSSGSYFQDRQPVDSHLPLARTRESKCERLEFLQHMTKIANEKEDE